MTIAKLYENHKKGKVSKQTFLYEARKDDNLPWISNLTSYEDAVKILKNKGVISEVNLNVPGAVGSSNQRVQHNSYSSNAEVNDDSGDVDTKGTYDIKLRNGEVIKNVKFYKNGEWYQETPTSIKLGGKVPDGASIDPSKSLNEAHTLTTSQIIDRLNVYEFMRAVDYEMSKLKVIDNISYEKVREKVAKKMAKDPLAYRYTQLANSKQIEKDDNRLAMKPVKGDNFVDKDNEMKKIKGHADEKKNTSTPKTENRKGKPKGVKEMKGSKKKPAGVKDVMKSETKETMINEMLNFFKKKDSIKENDGGTGGGIGGATPQERTDFYKGHECMTPDGIGIVIDRKGSIVTVELEDGNQKDYTLNVLDAAKEKHNQAQMDADKAERDQMWANWNKDQSSGKNPYAKTFGGTLEYKPEDIHTLLKKFKTIVEKFKMKKEAVDVIKAKTAQGADEVLDTVPAGQGNKAIQDLKKKISQKGGSVTSLKSTTVK